MQTQLKCLLKQRHWQEYGTFCSEYDRAAREVDEKLSGRHPSRAQFYRWLSGDLKELPYPHHCRVLEKMLPDWKAEELFRPATEEAIQITEGAFSGSGDPETHNYAQDVTIYLDATEQNSRTIAGRVRSASDIFFMAHTGYGFMVNQYQWAVRDAVSNGCRLRVVVSAPDGHVMQQPELRKRLCPSARQQGEVHDTLVTCARHRERAAEFDTAENVQAKVYAGVPSMNIVKTDAWLRAIPYMPLLDAGECPIFEYHFDPDAPSPLLRKFFISMERVWDDAQSVDLEELSHQEYEP
ncbi:hypothetical protein ACX9I7_01805 [Streptomyces sp. L500]